MSKAKKLGNYLNKKTLKQLSSLQNKIIENYEKNQNEDNSEKILPNKISNDFCIENLDNYKHNLKELPQYSSLYLKRLEMTKNSLFEESKKKWPKTYICPNILDLKGKVSSFIFYN